MTTKPQQEARYWPTVAAWRVLEGPALTDLFAAAETDRTPGHQCLNCGTHTQALNRGFCAPCRKRFP